MRVYVCMCVVCCVLCVCAFACKPKSAAQQHKKIHVFEIHVFLMYLVIEYVPCTMRMNDITSSYIVSHHHLANE